MYRRKTVDALLRDHARERAVWAAERAQLLDRIMYLVDKPWALPESAPPTHGGAPKDPYADFTMPELEAVD